MFNYRKPQFKELASELLSKAETPRKLKGYKAWIKKRYKEEDRFTQDAMAVPYPYNREKRILNIVRKDGENHGDHWTTVFFVEAKSVEQAKKIMDNYIAVDGYSINSPYDCTGEAFYYPADFSHAEGSNRVIVRQTGGLDV
jgi:hypothetical protein